MTTATRAVLRVLLDASPDDPYWGLRVCDEADLGAGTTYPILNRLTSAGWVDADWEGEYSAARPRRRLYRMSAIGRTEAAAALAAAEERRRAARPLFVRTQLAGGTA